EPHHTYVDPISSTSQPPHSPHRSPLQSPPHPSPPHPSPLHQSLPHSPPHSPPLSPPYFSPPRSYEAPLPEGNTSGSAEDSMQLKELMMLVPTLVTRINSLEKELKETKQTLGNAVLKLGVSKEKSTDKGKRYRRRARSMAKKIDTGLDAEEEINTAEEEINTGKEEINTSKEEINTGREEINTGIGKVSTGSTKVDSGTASKRGQREGNAPMVE
ncbi:hypothetical protein Tco_0107883, partial [Tanacetum coccineum]